MCEFHDSSVSQLLVADFVVREASISWNPQTSYTGNIYKIIIKGLNFFYGTNI